MSSQAENGGAESMEAVLGNVLEVLGQNPELMKLAGKLAGLSELTSEQSGSAERSGSFAEEEDKYPFDGLSALFGDVGGNEGREKEKTSDATERAVALFKALRPFMNDERGESVDRLLKVLPTAKTIRTALHAFGSL